MDTGADVKVGRRGSGIDLSESGTAPPRGVASPGGWEVALGGNGGGGIETTICAGVDVGFAVTGTA